MLESYFVWLVHMSQSIHWIQVQCLIGEMYSVLQIVDFLVLEGSHKFCLKVLRQYVLYSRGSQTPWEIKNRGECLQGLGEDNSVIRRIALLLGWLSFLGLTPWSSWGIWGNWRPLCRAPCTSKMLKKSKKKTTQPLLFFVAVALLHQFWELHILIVRILCVHRCDIIVIVT